MSGTTHMSKNDGRWWTWFDRMSELAHRSSKIDLGIQNKVLSDPFYRRDSLGPGRLKDLLGRTSQVSSLPRVMVLPFPPRLPGFQFHFSSLGKWKRHFHWCKLKELGVRV